MKKKRVLSGIQPTGKLHLGNLIGAIENWVKLQNEYECFFFIADLHALTTIYEEPSKLREDIHNAVIDLLASGIDPNKCTLFRQSDVSAHSELHVLLSMITPVPWLTRVPTYKGKIEELKEKNLDTYGFLGYPVLQASDILIYRADYVPVGEDQLAHLELTREIARRFNYLYSKVFPEPKELLTHMPTLPGLDGRKMSKSYRNTINLSDPLEEVKNKVSQMITDPARVKKEDKGHPDVCNIFAFHKIYDKENVKAVEHECKEALRGCVACKKQLLEHLLDYLSPIHKRRQELLKKPHEVQEILDKGALAARKVAEESLAHAKKAIGLL